MQCVFCKGKYYVVQGQDKCINYRRFAVNILGLWGLLQIQDYAILGAFSSPWVWWVKKAIFQAAVLHYRFGLRVHLWMSQKLKLAVYPSHFIRLCSKI